jgi:hypothetical protein
MHEMQVLCFLEKKKKARDLAFPDGSSNGRAYGVSLLKVLARCFASGVIMNPTCTSWLKPATSPDEGDFYSKALSSSTMPLVSFRVVLSMDLIHI